MGRSRPKFNPDDPNDPLHGTFRTYGRCRCDKCRAGAAAFKRTKVQQQGAEQLPPGDPRHGVNGYTNFHCRCDICRAAVNAKRSELRKRRHKEFRAGKITIRHGTRRGYDLFGCRCDLCKRAHSKYQFEAKLRRQATEQSTEIERREREA